MKFFYAIALLCLANTALAAESAIVSIEQFAGDKRAHKVENVKVITNKDGSTTAVALITYEDGQQEECAFVMNAELAEKDGAQGLNVTPKSRECTPAKTAN